MDRSIEIMPEEERFLADYTDKLDSLVGEITAHRGGEIAGLLRQLVRPDAWRVLLNLGKAENLMTKAWQTQRGQDVLAREEAQVVDREYDLRAAAVVKSLRDFTEFVDHARGQPASDVPKADDGSRG